MYIYYIALIPEIWFSTYDHLFCSFFTNSAF